LHADDADSTDFTFGEITALSSQIWRRLRVKPAMTHYQTIKLNLIFTSFSPQNYHS